MFTDDPAGNPARVTVKFAVAVEIALAASLVTMSSMRTVPEAVDSTPLIGGTSLAASSVDVNTGLGVGVGVGVGVGSGWMCSHIRPPERSRQGRGIRVSLVRLLVSRERGDQKNLRLSMKPR